MASVTNSEKVARIEDRPTFMDWHNMVHLTAVRHLAVLADWESCSY